MSQKEAIILAGGLGTRLKSVLPNVPKCMAPVNGIPFLDILISYLKREGVEHFILSLGYLKEAIIPHIRNHHADLRVSFSEEDEPLGTGGAIFMALLKAEKKHVFIFNGDTFFNVSLDQLEQFHLQKKADCSLALKPMKDFNRYGTVELGTDETISGFREKKPSVAGLINGGVYLLNRHAFLKEQFPGKFSFEDHYLSKYLEKHVIAGQVQDAYFIDIGIPEDYVRAQEELRIFL
jgi:D-glycero-alpha-D-manno-heptose 1-phosphate guanylyltransferase